VASKGDRWWCFGWNVVTPSLVERERERLSQVELERKREMCDVKRDMCFRVAWGVFCDEEREI
jgi:hypothetical protein